MDWFTLALISMVSLSLANIFQRVLMKDNNSDPFAYGIVFQFLAAIFIGIFAVINGFVMPPLKEVGIYLLFTGILYAGFVLFILKAYQTSQASEVTLVMTSRVIWTVLGAVLLLGETLTITKLIGISIIIGAIIFVFYEGKKIKYSKGIQYALLAAACFGLGFVNDAFILQKAEAISYTAIAFALPGIMLLLYKPSAILKLKAFANMKLLGKMMLLSIFQSTAALTIYFAYQKGGDASQLGPMGLSVVILTIILAAIFLGERNNVIKKVIAAILVMIGVYLLR